MPTVTSVCRILARIALTFFVVWQVVFLLTLNFLNVEKPLREAFKDWYWKDDLHKDVAVPEYLIGEGPIHKDYYEPAAKYTKRWSQLTGQPESWGLFAPTIMRVVPFPAVELRWDNQDWPDWAEPPALPTERQAAIVMLSDNEPIDRHCYAKFGMFRIRKYESEITTPYPHTVDGVFNPATPDWKEKISKKVREDPEAIRNYLRWRLEVWQRANPQLPAPTQVVLLVRGFEVPEPPGPQPWDWYDLGEHHMARWLPAAPIDAQKYQAVERFDPVSARFERVEK
jgi:hypothetical protein